MPRYLISFDDGSMDHIPEQDWRAVASRRIQLSGTPRPTGSGSSVAAFSASDRAS